MIAFFLAALAAPPAAADWTLVTENEKGVLALDPASIVTAGERRMVWTRAAMIDADGLASTMMIRTEIDCAARTSAKRELVPLDEDGAVTGASAIREALTPAAPGSIGAALVDRVCR